MNIFKLCFVTLHETFVEIEATSREEAWDIGRTMENENTRLASVATVPPTKD
ncbi:hypothetical protein AWB71_05336 [Caballeronia peredens]|nr:hypothetical protein AWB71_05336 [Caballeronia peredens]